MTQEFHTMEKAKKKLGKIHECIAEFIAALFTVAKMEATRVHQQMNRLRCVHVYIHTQWNITQP